MKRVRLIEDFIYEKGKKPESVAKKVKKLNKKIKKAVAKKEDLMKKSKEIEKEQKKGDAQPSDKLQKLLIKSQIKTAGIDAQKTQAKQQQLILKKKVKTAKDSEKAKKELTKENLFLEKDKLEWHDSDAPDANGRFKDLSPKDLATWLIKTRKGDMKKISGSLSQQVAFNKNDDKEYVKKMEKTRKEVYKQLDRKDLLDKVDESFLNEKISGENVWNHIVSITPEEDNIPWGFQDKIEGNNFKETKVDLKKLLKTDPDFAEYYKGGEERYDQDEIDEFDVYYELVVVDGELLDGYSRASMLLRNGEKKANAFVNEAYKNSKTHGVKDLLENTINQTMKQFHEQLDREALQEAYTLEDVYDLIANHRFKKDFKKLSAKDQEWVVADASERGFNESLLESDVYSLIDELYEAKPGPDPYHRGLDDEDVEDKEDQIKKQAGMDDDDPGAYKEMPGDKEARKKGEVKTSKATKKYSELYGDEDKKDESIINEEKAEGDRGPIGDDKIETALKKKAKDTGVPIDIIRIIMRRGMAAWKSGHRPGATQQMWGYARVNAFLTKGDGTWGGADKDVAKEVRDGGHDKGLKESLLTEEETYNDYPAAAKKNAKKAIDWKEEHGRDEVDAGTAVGWARAHQLAKGEKLSVDTVKRMASFNRHRKNSSIKPELKGTPWKDKGYVSWLIWGGDEGVDWAIKKSEEIDALEETNQMKYIKPIIINEGYWSKLDYNQWIKQNGKVKFPKWIKSTMNEIIQNGFMDKVYDSEHWYMTLWLSSFDTNTRSELYAYDNKGTKEFGRIGYSLIQRFWNDLTGYTMISFQAALAALEVSKHIRDMEANGESIEPAYYLMKEYFNNFNIQTNRNRVFDSAIKKLEVWMEDNEIQTL